MDNELLFASNFNNFIKNKRLNLDILLFPDIKEKEIYLTDINLLIPNLLLSIILEIFQINNNFKSIFPKKKFINELIYLEMPKPIPILINSIENNLSNIFFYDTNSISAISFQNVFFNVCKSFLNRNVLEFQILNIYKEGFNLNELNEISLKNECYFLYQEIIKENSKNILILFFGSNISSIIENNLINSLKKLFLNYSLNFCEICKKFYNDNLNLICETFISKSLKINFNNNNKKHEKSNTIISEFNFKLKKLNKFIFKN